MEGIHCAQCKYRLWNKQANELELHNGKMFTADHGQHAEGSSTTVHGVS